MQGSAPEIFNSELGNQEFEAQDKGLLGLMTYYIAYEQSEITTS